MESVKSVLSAYWPSIRKHRVLLCIGVCVMTAVVALKAWHPFLLRAFVDAFAVPESSAERIEQTLLLIVAFYVAINIAWISVDWAVQMFEVNVMRDLDERSFAAIQTQSMRFFENAFTGSLVKTANRFRNAFEGIADACFFQLGRSAILIVLTLVVFSLERPLLAIAFGFWTLLFLAASVYTARIRFTRSAAEAEADSAVGGRFADSFTNESTVKSFGKERDEQHRFADVVTDCFQKRKRSWMTNVVLTRARGVVLSVFEGFLLWWLVRGWQNGTVSVGDFVFFQTYALMLSQQLWEMSQVLHRFSRYFADAKEMAELFALRPEVENAPGARPLIIEDGAVEFHAVSFSYLDRETQERHDVHDFTLDVPARQSVALVGQSGAGKSTLVKLLLRYFDLHSGYIRIDRQDIANVTQESLRQQIALVPQQPELFHRSLRDNIAFARPDATEEEIIEAARRAHAWEFIQSLPHIFDTLVGERGVKLSGGERQRIALARAFLADAPIFILDEATSALDSKTEKLIQRAIADLLQRRTSIVIAHRLSTIMRMDRIIVMDRGAIVEDGTHRALLAQNGLYADLWAHQSGGYITG
jgi:ATP-binding cassette, subfamily B, bacterial